MTSSPHHPQLRRRYLRSLVTLVILLLHQLVGVSCQTAESAKFLLSPPLPLPPPRQACLPGDVFTLGALCDDLPGIVCPNTTRKLRDGEHKEIVMLASYPGSGNTWTRHLLEISTGLMTGGMYCDSELSKTFKGECDSDHPSAFVAYKTHYPYFGRFNFQGFFSDDIPFEKQIPKAIVVVRDPIDALVSEFKRTVSQKHTVEIPFDIFSQPRWNNYVQQFSHQWVAFHSYWLEKFEGEILYVLFEDLRDHTHREIQRMLHFLGRDLTHANCHYSDSEGKFKRKKEYATAPYNKMQVMSVARVCNKVHDRIKQKRQEQA